MLARDSFFCRGSFGAFSSLIEFLAAMEIISVIGKPPHDLSIVNENRVKSISIILRRSFGPINMFFF